MKYIIGFIVGLVLSISTPAFSQLQYAILSNINAKVNEIIVTVKTIESDVKYLIEKDSRK